MRWLFKNLLTRTNLITAGLFLAPMTSCFYIRPQLDTIIFCTLVFVLTYVSEAVRHQNRLNWEARWKLVEDRKLQADPSLGAGPKQA